MAEGSGWVASEWLVVCPPACRVTLLYALASGEGLTACLACSRAPRPFPAVIPTGFPSSTSSSPALAIQYNPQILSQNSQVTLSAQVTTPRGTTFDQLAPYNLRPNV